METSISVLPSTLKVTEEERQLIKKVIATVGNIYGLKNTEVSVLLTDDENMHAFNKKYRNIDRPTDVLSFALDADSVDEDEPIITNKAHIILGDLIISLERAKKQAKDYGHTYKRELAFLTAHGMLHLLGYDHQTKEDRCEMEEEQRNIMEKLNISRYSSEEKEKENTQKYQHLAYKSGFISVIGRPNVGKSTLINTLLGQKIAIMSDKPQTTRHRILAILTREDMQLIFIDTPGIHKPRHKLGKYMEQVTENSLKGVDAIFFVVDANEKMGKGEKYIIERLKKTDTPVILVINKVDLCKKKELLPIIDHYSKAYDFASIVPISAKNKVNLEELLLEGKRYLPKGPCYYPEDMVTDQQEREIIRELIREKVLHATHDEVPHAIAVDIDEIKDRPKGDSYVRATIYVERSSQKGIVIGKSGSMLREIGKEAREDIEILLGKKVYLDLWVKVKKDWRNHSLNLKEFGFTFEK